MSKKDDVTPRSLFLSRREIMRAGAAVGVTAATAGLFHSLFSPRRRQRTAPRLATLPATATGTTAATAGANLRRELTPYGDVTTYNNFYELGTGKNEPAENTKTLLVRPWTVVVDGEVHAPRTFDLDELLKLAPLEERIYRLRCVEGWSMVIPWTGYGLRTLMDRVRPTTRAKYVELTTLLDPQQLPGQKSDVLDWPYVEGLRIDEAAHPLTLLCLGLYGETLPVQNGAPVRVIVPWKYGFKSPKSIVRIRFVEDQPVTTWNAAAPTEYGFFSNVNPQVDHPRWSQAKERRIGELGKRDTLLFNGYGAEVAHLYAGLDLKKSF